MADIIQKDLVVFSAEIQFSHTQFFTFTHMTNVLLKGRCYLHCDSQSSLLHQWSCHSTPAHPGWDLCWCKWCRRRSVSRHSAGVGHNSEVLQIDDSLERSRGGTRTSWDLLSASFDLNYMAFCGIQDFQSCSNWYFYINNGRNASV